MKTNTIRYVYCLLSLLLLAACGHRTDDLYTLDLRLTSGPNLPGEEWYLYTYGTSQVTIDTLRGHSPHYKQSFDRDSTDIFVLRDERGMVVMPIIPDTIPVIKIRLGGKKEQLKGLKDADALTEWRSILLSHPDSIMPQKLLDFFNLNADRRVAMILIQDAIMRYPHSSCADELSSAFSRASARSSDLSIVLGTVGYDRGRFPSVVTFPYHLRVPQGARKGLTTHDAIGTKGYMAIAILDSDSFDKQSIQQMERYLSELDSLGVPSYTTILFADALPTAWKDRVGDKRLPSRYFDSDSIGTAADFVQQIPIDHFPSFMVVDSLLTIWRTWDHPVSLIHFLQKTKPTATK